MLKTFLIINAGFSFICASLMWLLSEHLSHDFGSPMWLWDVLALVLVLFCVQLLLVSFKQWFHRLIILAIIAADVSWIVVSTLVSIFFINVLSLQAWGWVIGTNVIIGLLAVGQYQGWQQWLSAKQLTN